MNKQLGRWVVTQDIANACKADPSFEKFVHQSMNRYVLCDWGELSPQDSAANDSALQNGDDRIFAQYTDALSDYRIWIITEWDRSVTTILFPGEY